MKKIMIALVILGSTYLSAQAQTNKCVCHSSKTVAVHKVHKVAHVTRPQTNLVSETRTYQVCRNEGGYYTCCLYKNITTKPVSENPLAVK